ncbi:MAG: helix-turn-helix transcriptional regulator [Lachnospiraceae bacterium]|nr:helix-turn-helix transcriptional regulator [Lachnospiraceae bacterium]
MEDYHGTRENRTFYFRTEKRTWTYSKKLAEQLNITDKAVSKWECGYSLPDNSVMLKLCDILGISVNELLSAERLSSTDYNKKAEENIMTLIQENNESKKKSRWQVAFNVIAVVLLVLYFIWFINRSTENRLELTYFMDFISMNVVIVLPLVMLILAKQMSPFLNIFRYNIHKCNDSIEKQKAKNAASFAIKAILLSGGICTVIYFVNWMRCLDNAGYWGPNLTIIILGPFYSFLLSGILLILKERI